MMDKHMRRNHPPTKYKPGDKVLLRLTSRKGRIAPKRRHILKGRVVARNLKTLIYKVSFINPNSREQKWTSVEDITSVSSQEEKVKRKEPEQKNKEAVASKEISYCFNSRG